MKAPGIYAILNTITGRAYVGSSNNMHKRWLKHKAQLAAGLHHCAHLQASWRKHGADAFAWLVLETCEVADLYPREDHHIIAHRAAGGVYNTAPAAGSCRGLVKGPMPEDIRAKIAATHVGMRPDETARAAMREAAKRRPPISNETRQKFVERMTGRKMGPLTDEHRAKISAVHSGKTISAEHRAALSRAHKGRTLSEEHRRKQSEAAKLQHARAREAKAALAMIERTAA